MNPGLEIDLRRRVHDGLTIHVRLSLGRECGVIFGPSGAGKTTLLRLIAGLDRPDSGSVVVEDQTWFDSRAKIHRPLRSRRVGMIFQDDRLFPHLNVADNIRFGLRGWNRSDRDHRVAEVANLTGVGSLLDRRPATLSGGERQRVGLARSLAPKPRLLLADEPVSALDLASRFAILDRLKQIQEIETMPVLLVTHSPAEALALGGRLFLLQQGTITDDGPALDVLARRRNFDIALNDVRNIVRGVISKHCDSPSETIVNLDENVRLIIPRSNQPVGTPVRVSVRADEIVLARGEILGLSARNLLLGRVERVVPHAGGVEVVIGVGSQLWIVSVGEAAVACLELQPGAEVRLIVKARSCHIL